MGGRGERGQTIFFSGCRFCLSGTLSHLSFPPPLPVPAGHHQLGRHMWTGGQGGVGLEAQEGAAREVRELLTKQTKPHLPTTKQ